MRNKLALTIALASFGVVTALGVGFAGADDPRPPKPRKLAAPLSTTPSAPAVPPAACSNGLDDDHDGLVDSEDPDCASPEDTNEEAEQPTTGTSIEAPALAQRPRPTAQGGRGRHHDRRQRWWQWRQPQQQPRRCQRRRWRKQRRRCRRPSATAGVQPPTESSSGGSPSFTNGGSPPSANPTATIAPFGPAPIGVPNFVIDSFEIPPFLLPIYQACGTEYGIPWEVLASINKIETGFGTNLNVSSAGAVGWMQFLPSSWEAFGARRQRRRAQRPLQPGRRDLRRRPLPEGSPAAPRTSTTRSSPTTTPTGTCRRCSSTRAPTASSRPTWSAR